MPQKISWPNHEKPLVILAPMDGYTDPPFRRFIKRVAPRSVVFSEFLSAATVARKPALAADWFKIYPDERPVVIQLYGKDPRDFKKAAVLAEEMGAAGVDVNMGCPAKKVVAHQHGSALMKNIDLACEIVSDIKAAVRVPVSVKTRLGWEDERNLIPFIQRLASVGLDAITVHGRTYRQKFEGAANWEPIYLLKEAVRIPVFGNGDIDSVAAAREKIGNLDGVMVGRAAVADPWLMRDLCAAFFDGNGDGEVLAFTEKIALWKAFAEMSVEHRSELHACRAFRKYLVRLIRDLGLDLETRRRSTSVSTLQEIFQVLDLFALQAGAEKTA